MHIILNCLDKANIKTENQLMSFSDSSWKDCPDTGKSTGAYIIFYQVGKIDHVTHVTVSVSQSGAESEYNEACTLGMSLAHSIMLICELLKKDTDIVPEAPQLIILDSKSVVCMSKNYKDNNNNMNISRRVNLVINLKCKRFIGVKEVLNWQTLQIRILEEMI